MTEPDLRTLRKQLGVSQRTLAEDKVLLDIGFRSYQAYERGERPVPRVVWLAMKQLVTEKEKQ
jgi:transcriptional regulator with XRE-family HTH domain